MIYVVDEIWIPDGILSPIGQVKILRLKTLFCIINSTYILFIYFLSLLAHFTGQCFLAFKICITVGHQHARIFSFQFFRLAVLLIKGTIEVSQWVGTGFVSFGEERVVEGRDVCTVKWSRAVLVTEAAPIFVITIVLNETTSIRSRFFIWPYKLVVFHIGPSKSPTKVVPSLIFEWRSICECSCDNKMQNTLIIYFYVLGSFNIDFARHWPFRTCKWCCPLSLKLIHLFYFKLY